MLQVPGVTGAQLSALNLDKSMLLEQVLQKQYHRDSRQLLGELQFAFLAFLMGQSLEGGPCKFSLNASNKEVFSVLGVSGHANCWVSGPAYLFGAVAYVQTLVLSRFGARSAFASLPHQARHQQSQTEAPASLVSDEGIAFARALCYSLAASSPNFSLAKRAAGAA